MRLSVMMNLPLKRNSDVDRGQRQIIFVCGTPHGGALDSTVALARCAIDAGHKVEVVVAAADLYATNRRLNALIVRMGRWSGRLRSLLWSGYERWYGTSRREVIGGVRALRAQDVVGASRRLLRGGDVLVVNSVRRLDLERLCLIKNANVMIAWYLREESSLSAVAEFGSRVDVLLANSRPLSALATSGAGRGCLYVPSVITVDDLCEPVDRRVVLLVNAVPSYGLEEAFAIARLMPQDHVVLQESWPLSSEELAVLRERLAEHPNVEFRSRVSRPEVFRDARVVLLPHSAQAVGAHRPRVALEAQYLGFPVIAYDVPGLAAVTSSPELLISLGSPIRDWVDRIRLVDAEYEHFVAAARAFAADELLDPIEVWNRFADSTGLAAVVSGQ